MLFNPNTYRKPELLAKSGETRNPEAQKAETGTSSAFLKLRQSHSTLHNSILNYSGP